MVVTRRMTPVAPSPPVSRSQSSQGAPRPARASLTQDIGSAPMASSPLASGGAHTVASATEVTNGFDNHEHDADKHSVRKSKKNKPKKLGKSKRRKSNFQAFLDFMFKLLLLAFTIYTLSVCPQDSHQQTPLCRGLSEYKRIVLDPYIIPPLQAAFSHPSIAPHVERARPYVHRVIEVTVPIISRAQSQWNQHVIPQWEKYVVPEWNRHVVPQWRRHIAPRVDTARVALAPYRRQVETVYYSFAPRAHRALYNLQRWQRQARPYILLAASKTHEGYNAAKPYTAPLVKRAGLALQHVALFLQDQRQHFVDPHVAKIWDKVKELSRGKQAVGGPVPTLQVSSPTEEQGPSTEVVSPESAPISVGLPEDALTSTVTPSPSPILQTTSGNSKLSVTQSSANPVEHVTPTPYVTSTAVGSAFSGTPEHTDSIAVLPSQMEYIESLEVEAISEDTVLSDTQRAPEPQAPVVEPITKESSPSDDSSSRAHVVDATSTPAIGDTRATLSGNNDEIDMDAFYAELGLDEPLNASNNSQEQFVPLSTESEEELAEQRRLKAEETARKRADIELRHVKWEAELQAQIKQSTAELHSRLRSLREAGAAELSSSVEVRHAIDGLASEAEKYIKGAEIYLKNLKGENRKREEKLALWDRVVEKVAGKFTERLSATESAVFEQYSFLRELELREVTSATLKVRDIAEKGQVDLGLDYAWLDDVTYNDWQRYHGLIQASENFAQEAASIQNGTHPSDTAPNPVLPVIEDIESEIRDIAIAFETRLRRIKRDGERAFNNGNGNGTASHEEDKVSATEPEVSILPIPDATERPNTVAVPPVIIGRSQEEVLEALKKVQPHDGQETLSTAKGAVDPEEVVSSLVREIEVEKQVRSESSTMSHTEL